MINQLKRFSIVDTLVVLLATIYKLTHWAFIIFLLSFSLTLNEAIVVLVVSRLVGVVISSLVKLTGIVNSYVTELITIVPSLLFYIMTSGDVGLVIGIIDIGLTVAGVALISNSLSLNFYLMKKLEK